jgi:hypothetical protein
MINIKELFTNSSEKWGHEVKHVVHTYLPKNIKSVGAALIFG